MNRESVAHPDGLPQQHLDKPSAESDPRSPFALIDHVKIQLEPILNQIDVKVDLAGEVVGSCNKIQQAVVQNVDASVATLFLEKRERYSVFHPVDTAILCEIVSKRLGYSSEDRKILLAAALTMNIAMVKLQDILYFQKEILTDGQKNEVKSHPERGIEILQRCGVRNQAWLEMVLLHHKFWDGMGYPENIQCHDIPQLTRILTISDIFCAKVSGRGYRVMLKPDTSWGELFLGIRGHRIDLELVTLFIKEIGIYPPGTLVRLKNGEIAVVTHRVREAHRPVVHSIMHRNGTPLLVPIRRDCSLGEFSIEASVPASEIRFQIDRHKLWG